MRQRLKIKLPFGLNENNTLVHITDVESGKKCGCVCPSCRSSLIAAKGSKKQHHFRHDTDHECENGLESAIHLAAKKVILERKQITLPEYVSSASAKDSKGIKHTEQETVVRDGTIMHFDFIRDETTLNEIRADILATKGNTALIIEIFYRHKVNDQKRLKIIEANISAIEVDLSDLTPKDVKDWKAFWLCINDPQRIQWLYNAKAHNSIYQKLESRLEVKLQAQEEKYKQEEIQKTKKEQKEKEQLLQALHDLKHLRSKEYIMQLGKKAETHPVWEHYRKYITCSWHELPDFLSVDVPDGDWIFGCDRRIWQTAFYTSFIHYKGRPFTVKRVCDWLQEKGCKLPFAAKTVGIYGRKYPQLVPDDILGNLPSTWGTLKIYCNYLCDLGVLEYSGEDWKSPGSFWFKVISKNSQ